MSQQKKQWNIPHRIEKYTISNIKLARLYLDLARGERRNLNKYLTPAVSSEIIKKKSTLKSSNENKLSSFSSSTARGRCQIRIRFRRDYLFLNNRNFHSFILLDFVKIRNLVICCNQITLIYIKSSDACWYVRQLNVDLSIQIKIQQMFRFSARKLFPLRQISWNFFYELLMSITASCQRFFILKFNCVSLQLSCDFRF